VTSYPTHLDAAQFGAVAGGVVDATAAIQRAIDACPVGRPVRGGGLTYGVTTLNLKSDMQLEDFNLVQVGNSNFFSPVTIGAYYLQAILRNIAIRNVVIDGRRQQQTGIEPTTEDGGRHGFRIVGAVENLLIEGCSASYCGTDGIMFGEGAYTRPDDYSATQPMHTGVIVRNSQFNFNRRHGGSGECFDGVLFDNCDFNDNGQDLDDFSAATSGNRGALSNGLLYGNGYDLEGYSVASSYRNVAFRNCRGLRNVRAGLLFYDATDPASVGFVLHSDLTVDTCTLDAGTQGGVYYAVGFTPSDSVAANGYAFSNVIVINNTLTGSALFKCVDGGSFGGGSVTPLQGFGYVGAILGSRNISIAEFTNPSQLGWY
jgi:hypothetical protein